MKGKKSYFGSTEPQARKVEEKTLMGRRKKIKPTKQAKQLDPTKPTAKTPRGVQKSKAQGEQERQRLRKKQRERIRGKQNKSGY